MAGIFGVVSNESCGKDLFWGTHYLQHRAQDYCGLYLCSGKKYVLDETHRGLVREKFDDVEIGKLDGNKGLGVVANDRQPVSELSRFMGIVLGFDGNIVNYEEIKNKLLKEGCNFSGYRSPEEISDTVLVSRIISRQPTFDKGIENLLNEIEGDFAVAALTPNGIYAARGYGRKPLILGRKDGSYAVASESNSFVNTRFKIERDVEPGETIFLDEDGIHTVNQIKVENVKYGTFEWIYYAYPSSTIDGKNVASVRMEIGKRLARRFPVNADIVSPVPNSGRWHALGFQHESGLPYVEAFLRYEYSGRSFTPSEQEKRDKEAETKLIINEEAIRGKRIVLLDDSIVRGTQMENKVRELKECGAKEVHVRIACPPLMAACKYGKSTKKDEDCIARRISVEEIQKKFGFDSLGYATIEDLEGAIGYPREKLCLECWALPNVEH